MRLSEFVEYIGCYHDIGPRMWAEAVNLGDARGLSNSHNRHKRFIEKPKVTREFNIVGGAAELRLIEALSESENSKSMLEYTRGRLFHPGGGSKVWGSDFLLYDNWFVNLDVKGHPCHYGYKYAIIHEGRWEQSVPGPVYYIKAFTPLFGKRIWYSWLIPYAEVLRWEWYKEDEDHSGPDNGRKMELDRFCLQYMPKSFNYRELLDLGTYSEKEIESLRHDMKYYKESKGEFKDDREVRGPDGGDSQEDRG